MKPLTDAELDALITKYNSSAYNIGWYSKVKNALAELKELRHRMKGLEK